MPSRPVRCRSSSVTPPPRPVLTVQSPKAREVAGKSGGPAVLGEGVDEAVGGPGVALSDADEESGAGGQQDERGEVEVAGEFVQVPGRVGLRPQDRVDLLGCEGARQGVVHDAGGVHDTAQGPVLGDVREEAGQSGAVGDVAGHGGRFGAERGEFRQECAGAGRVRSAAAGQQQVAHAVFGDEAPGDEGAEAAGASGDENGSLGVPGRGPFGLVDGDAGEPGDADVAAAHRELGFAQGGERGGDPASRTEVGEQDAARVLLLGAAYEAPDGRLYDIRGLVGAGVVADGDTLMGDHHQPGAGEAFVGQEGPDRVQHVAQHGPHRGRDLPGGAGAGVEDEIRHEPVGVESGGEGRRAVVGGCVVVDSGVRGVGADERPPARGGAARGAERQVAPADPVQRLTLFGSGRGGCRGGDPVGSDGPDDEGLHRGDGQAGPVGQFQPYGVRAYGVELDPHVGGAAGVEGDPGPGEGQVGGADVLGAVAPRKSVALSAASSRAGCTR